MVAPKQVTILGKPHRIRWNAKIPSDRWGDYDGAKALIRIGKAPLLQQKEALLHEVMHAIEEQYGFEMDHDHLTLMARGLLSVMRENPEMRDVLFGD